MSHSQQTVSPLRQRMIMNAERLRGWPAFREEILQVRRAQAAAVAASTAEICLVGPQVGISTSSSSAMAKWSW